MSFELEELRALVDTHDRVGRIVIVDHKGSAPRETGTAMLVWQTGQSGTIGGGALEYQVVAALRERLHTGGANVDRLPLGPALGQCCGGAVTLVSEVFDADRLGELSIENGLVLRALDGETEPFWVKRLRQAQRGGQPAQSLIFRDGWLVETISEPQTALWIYGAGHVGRALVSVLAPLPELAITWVDTGEARFPEEVPERVTCLPAPNPAAATALAPCDANHLIVTYSHALDLELCHRLLGHGFASAGVIGSATKWARFSKRLKALGHSDAQITRIACPIGDPYLGKHPQAIALSTATTLLSALRVPDITAQGRQVSA